MGTPRNVSNPIIRTYINTTSSSSGTKFHVRVSSRRSHLDKKGSGLSIEEAVANAIQGVLPPKKVNRKKTANKSFK